MVHIRNVLRFFQRSDSIYSRMAVSGTNPGSPFLAELRNLASFTWGSLIGSKILWEGFQLLTSNWNTLGPNPKLNPRTFAMGAPNRRCPISGQGCLFQGNKPPPPPHTIIASTIQKEVVYFKTKANFQKQPCSRKLHRARAVPNCSFLTVAVGIHFGEDPRYLGQNPAFQSMSPTRTESSIHQALPPKYFSWPRLILLLLETRVHRWARKPLIGK